MPGADDAEAAWMAAQAGAAAQGAAAASPVSSHAARDAQAAQAAAEGQPGWVTGQAAGGYACDAAITPVVTGRIDQAALAALAAGLLAGLAGRPGGHAGRGPLPPAVLERLRQTLLRHAAAVLSGPGGLAAFLRTRLTGGQFPSASLPLDTGTPASLITGALRRAVITRDRHCAFPGCGQPPPACQVHHLTPRAHGGPTRLGNLVLLCAFHHLIAVHQWGLGSYLAR
jgi:hypothetical protein